MCYHDKPQGGNHQKGKRVLVDSLKSGGIKGIYIGNDHRRFCIGVSQGGRHGFKKNELKEEIEENKPMRLNW